MTDKVTNELMYEILKKLQGDMLLLKEGQRETKAEMSALRGHVHAIQTDVGNIYSKIVGIELRLEHIEGRLGLISEPAQ
jgi:hypothetical protein